MNRLQLPTLIFFMLTSGLQKITAAFRLSQKTLETYFSAEKFAPYEIYG